MNTRTRVKICGITRIDDAIAAAQAGADAIGIVFWPKSPRAVSMQQAADIVAALPPFVTTVGLFVDPDAAAVTQASRAIALDCLQFHGHESAEFCAGFELPWIKALHVRSSDELSRQMQQYKAAAGLLLDSFDPKLIGGTGVTFDWGQVPGERQRPLIVAGGLNAQNVAAAVRQLHPWAVDVSTGVESAPGLKDAQKMTRFVEAVHHA